MKIAVLGGGPAGSASALRLARLGHDVTLYEKRPFPRRKLCGGYLSARTVHELAGLGVWEGCVAAGAMTVQRLRVSTPWGCVAETLLPEPGASLSRNVMDSLLLDAARAAGVQTRTEPAPAAIDSDWVVVATGRQPAARQGGLFGIQASFEEMTELEDRVELHLVPRGYVGLVRQGTNTVNLCALVPRKDLLAHDPDDTLLQYTKRNRALARRLSRSKRVSPWITVGPVQMGMRQLVDGHRLFVGDSACVVDPFVGEGLAMGLMGAHALASAFQSTPLTPETTYPALWHRLGDASRRSGSILRSLLSHPLPRELLVGASSAAPGLLRWAVRSTLPAELS